MRSFPIVPIRLHSRLRQVPGNWSEEDVEAYKMLGLTPKDPVVIRNLETSHKRKSCMVGFCTYRYASRRILQRGFLSGI